MISKIFPGEIETKTNWKTIKRNSYSNLIYSSGNYKSQCKNIWKNCARNIERKENVNWTKRNENRNEELILK